MFQHFRSGKASVFGDVSHQNKRSGVCFGISLQFCSRFAYLGNCARGGFQLIGLECLYGVYHYQIGVKRFGVL